MLFDQKSQVHAVPGPSQGDKQTDTETMRPLDWIGLGADSVKRMKIMKGLIQKAQHSNWQKLLDHMTWRSQGLEASYTCHHLEYRFRLSTDTNNSLTFSKVQVNKKKKL